MALAEKLLKINEIKTDIRNAIASVGGEIDESTPFTEYASIIKTLNKTEDSVEIEES